jgi:hypothetical protein
MEDEAGDKVAIPERAHTAGAGSMLAKRDGRVNPFARLIKMKTPRITVGRRMDSKFEIRNMKFDADQIYLPTGDC